MTAEGFECLQYRDHNRGAKGKLSVFSILHLGAPSLDDPASIAGEAARVDGGPMSSFHEEFYGRAYGLGYIHALDPESSCRSINSVLELFERYISRSACISMTVAIISQPCTVQISCCLFGRHRPTEASPTLVDGQLARTRWKKNSVCLGVLVACPGF